MLELRRFSSIRGQLVLAFLLSALVPVVAYMVLAQLQTNAALTRAERTEALRSTATVHALLERVQAEDRANLLSHVPTLSSGTGFGRPAAQKLARSIARTAIRSGDGDVVFVQVVTAGGLSMLPGTLLSADALTALGTSPNSLLPRPRSDVTTILSEPYLVTAASLKARGTEHPVATVVLARPLDDDAIADAAALTDTHVAVFVNDVLVASSTRRDDDALPRFLAFGASDGEVADSGDWTMSFSTLDTSGDVLLRVAIPRAPYAAAATSLSSTGRWLIPVCVAIALLTALVIWRTFGQRLRSLGAAARALAAGNKPPRLDARGHDDIAVVAQAFNDMSSAVSTRFTDLTGQLDELSVSLSELNLVGETLASSPDVERELFRVAKMLRDMTGSDVAAFHLDTGGALLRRVVAGDAGASMNALDRVAAQAAGGSAVYLPDLHDHEPGAGTPSSRSVLASVRSLPLVHQGQILGTVTIASTQSRRYEGRSATLLGTVASQTALALSQARTYQELERSYLETVSALLAALEALDAYTADHGGSLIDLVLVVGMELGLETDTLRRLRFAAALHDIGKIGVPPHILRKPGPLDDEERAIIRQHTIIGERIVSRIRYLQPIARIIRSAHERWDGNGYPDGLCGTDTPLEARIVFACDAYDAMTSDRPYRRGRSPEEAMEELRRNAGTQFDPSVVRALERGLSRVPVVAVETDPEIELAAGIRATE